MISPTEALTANHCLEETTGHMWVKDSDGRSFEASVERQDKQLDLCLLKIKGPDHKYVEFGSPVSVGEPIYLMSNQMDIPYTYAEGIVNNLLIDPDSHAMTIMHSAVMTSGASGSGVFNKRGQLVGLNDYTIKSISFAIDVTVIKQFMTGKAR